MDEKSAGKNKLIKSLKQHFKNSLLPGKSAHLEFLPEFREYYSNITYKDAGVGVILLFNNQLQLILIKRTEDDTPHSGQIAFPGGSKENFDNNLLDTTYREIFEEIGIKKNCLEYISTLTPIFIPVSKYKVTPFVFFLKHHIILIQNNNEVNGVFYVNIRDLERSKGFTKVKIKSEYKTVLAFLVNGLTIWGATAMIINELLYILKDFNNEH